MTPEPLTPGEAELSVAAAYDRRAVEYEAIAGEIAQMDHRDRDLIARWRDASSGALLDAGCGPGVWTCFLHEGGRSVAGVDLSAAFVETARRRYPHLSFSQGTFRELPQPDGSVGGILAWYSLIHTPPAEVPDVLAEFARVLAPGGTLLLGFFDGEPGEPFAHAVTTGYFWAAEELERLLAVAGLAVEWSETRERRPGEVSARPHGALIARRL